MKKTTLIFALFLFAGLTAQTAAAQDIPDSENFLRITRFLEANPFEDRAKQAREWAFLYLVETKDVSVTLCSGTMKLIPEKKNKYKSELLMQFNLGMGAFKLENPDQKDDEIAAQVAGLESMLKAYEAMVVAKPKAKNDEMDTLLAKRDSGELKAMVENTDCGTD
jgi:hypothetical protein